MNFVRYVILTTLIPVFYSALTAPLLAHELWLEPEKYQVETGEPAKIHIRNGESFAGISLSYFTNRIRSFRWASQTETGDVISRSGDVPAATVIFEDEGLASFVYESTPSTLTYSKWEKFVNFVTHKDAVFAIEDHQERDLPKTGFKEVYYRFSKVLLSIGEASGMDKRQGLLTEFVALENPYSPIIGTHLPVALFHKDQPRINAQVEVFERAPDGRVTVFTVRTNEVGVAKIPLNKGHEYLLDAVIVQKPILDIENSKGAVWESLWAALTFEVPK